MTIERSSIEMQILCNACPASLRPHDKADFDIMLDEARRHGWRISNEDGTWTHHCPDCQAAAGKQRRLF